jgi:hypothetical protein
VERRNVEISALETLRDGFFHLLVAVIMVIAAEAASVFSTSLPDTLIGLAGIVGTLTFLILLLLVVVVVVLLYAIFGKIRPGMRQLSEVDNGFRICYTGTAPLIAGLLIVVLGLIMVATAVEERPGVIKISKADFIAGLVVILVGGIIGLIGHIMTLVVGAFKLHGKYQNSLYMVAGILFVVDIILVFLGLGRILTEFLRLGGILSAVGCIIMYNALGDTINKLSTAVTTPAQT